METKRKLVLNQESKQISCLSLGTDTIAIPNGLTNLIFQIRLLQYNRKEDWYKWNIETFGQTLATRNNTRRAAADHSERIWIWQNIQDGLWLSNSRSLYFYAIASFRSCGDDVTQLALGFSAGYEYLSSVQCLRENIRTFGEVVTCICPPACFSVRSRLQNTRLNSKSISSRRWIPSDQTCSARHDSYIHVVVSICESRATLTKQEGHLSERSKEVRRSR